MPAINIDLSGKALASLQEVVEDFNAQTGQTLKLEDWITLHLKELAVAKQLAADSNTYKADVDQEVGRRVAARRRELLEGLDAV
jgi:hypothetical protein